MRMMLFWITFMVIVGYAVIIPTNGHNCTPRQYVYEGRCCDMCMPGMFVDKNCTMTVQTSCKDCEVGTVPDGWNDRSECSSCPAGQYYDINLSFCMDCHSCSEGEYPIRTCSKTLNTECAVCPENHYSNVSENKNMQCKACTSCKKYAKMCTSDNDAICSLSETQTTTATTYPSTISMFQPANKILNLATTTRAKASHSNNWNNIYTAAVALIVLMVVIVLSIIFCWCARTKSRCQTGDRRGFLARGFQRTKYVPLKTGFLLRNQPASFILNLAERLNPDGRPNWKNLASKFADFTYDEIANFELDRCTAAERMLGSWQVKNSATVDKLHRCCLEIGREDVATYVADFFASATITPV